MGRPVIDLTGQKFNRLVVLEFSHMNRWGNACWKAICDCGREVTVASGEVLKGRVGSCGCITRERAAKLGRAVSTTHGETAGGKATPEYHAWQHLRQRCGNPLNPEFGRYGARGIRVCDRWLRFENFLADMGRRPGKGYSIDRINNDGNYEPGNCRWATAKQQAMNRRPPRPSERRSEKGYDTHSASHSAGSELAAAGASCNDEPPIPGRHHQQG